MFEPISLLIAPLIVLLIGLFLEYFIIQPFRNSTQQNPPQPPNRIQRILFSSISFNANKVSAKFIESFGYFFIALPLFVASLLASLLAIPIFMILHISEKTGSCIYHPTCKEYLVQSIEVHGPSRGLILGIARFLRCNPFVRGGHDPVPAPTRNAREYAATKFDPSKIKTGLGVILKAILFLLLIFLFLSWIDKLVDVEAFLSSIPLLAQLSVSVFTMLSALWIGGYLATKFISLPWWVISVLMLVIISLYS